MKKKIKITRILTLGYSYYVVPDHVDIGELVYALAQALPCDYHGNIQEGEVEVSAKSVVTVIDVEDEPLNEDDED